VGFASLGDAVAYAIAVGTGGRDASPRAWGFASLGDGAAYAIAEGEGAGGVGGRLAR